MDTTREIEAILAFMGHRQEQAGAEGFVVGLSGGIDSAVVAALAARVPRSTLTLVLMPCHSSAGDAHDARLVAAALGTEPLTVDLSATYDALLAALPQLTELARANVKPRLRMTTLYAIAQSRQSLVVGTGNRTELELGYFTKYGDGGADLLPLGAYLKREVRELALALNVPEPIVTKPPSAGLWEGQTDEDEMGMRYEAIDRVLGGEDTSSKIAQRIEAMRIRARHKRAMAPICERP